MRSTLIVTLIGASLLPAIALAQTATAPTAPPQTAAIEATPAPAPTTTGSGVKRDQFIERAKERAGQRAAARFDQMDTDHDGVLDRAEIGAWRGQHPRRAAAQPTQHNSTQHNPAQQ